ncbi:hypothetical protein AA15669_1332 [Saccharibacter floricola DSM 15669]|uniref:Uncharacterized protein n=1 Tax=Saccharibacter floricola DSM 15669 TaxID=1123227 RepID=A0ABQ0NZE8_9PROT|nr:hypothetical protein AA15669_1332 [Saccharibacter floricola DSM 15669]
MRDDMVHGQHPDHAVRGTRISEECDEMFLTSDHTDKEEKGMSDALHRCFGGDV